jgi:hypothetical protein
MKTGDATLFPTTDLCPYSLANSLSRSPPLQYHALPLRWSDWAALTFFANVPFPFLIALGELLESEKFYRLASVYNQSFNETLLDPI